MDKFGELDELKDEFDKLNCNFGDLDKLMVELDKLIDKFDELEPGGVDGKVR